VLLERGLGVLWVGGGAVRTSRNHLPATGTFSLKDRDAQLRCAMFRMNNSLVGFTPRAGAQVLVRGRISVYEARGEYQLIVEHLEEAGIGALRREFERLKAKLASRRSVCARVQTKSAAVSTAYRRDHLAIRGRIARHSA